MGLHFQSVVVLFLLVWSFWLPPLLAKSPSASPRALDSLLQDYAYRAFVHPRTGIPYYGTVPSNLTGIKISGMRLRSGSLRSRGVKQYQEFEIPVGVMVKPYVERLILVYQNLGSLSNLYYPLSSYTYLAPVLGLIAYNAANLSATNLSTLDIRASMSPILIHFSSLIALPDGVEAKCVWFDLQGTVHWSKVVSKNTCSTTQQGHFALVVEGTVPAPVSAPAPAPAPVAPASIHKKRKKTKNTKKVWIIGSVVAGVFLFLLLGLFLAWLKKFQHRKKMQQLEKASEVGETLRMTSVGSGKAPAATVTRTQPSLETEYT